MHCSMASPLWHAFPRFPSPCRYRLTVLMEVLGQAPPDLLARCAPQLLVLADMALAAHARSVQAQVWLLSGSKEG